MARVKNTRTANGDASVYLGSDGSWHGRVTVGTRLDGRPDRRHVRGKSRAAVAAKVKALKDLRDAHGQLPAPGQRWTVGSWLDHWLHVITQPRVRASTYAGYDVDVRVHLVPVVGRHVLANLTPEHIEQLYRQMSLAGSAPATIHHVHRTLRTALAEAQRRGHLLRNPAAIARPPRQPQHEIEPFTVAEIQRLLKAAGERRNSARWAIALSLGLRQGEALGLRWSDVDLDTGTLVVRRSRTRPRWTHGCDGTCGKKKGGYCPQRVPVRGVTDETKSAAGRRAMGLPEQLVLLLRQHQAAQLVERERAGSLWTDGGWLFASLLGEPLNPRTDYTEWKRLLLDAGVRDARLHDARHSAATVLLLLGVPDRAVMGIMGWSKADMMLRYQHLTGTIRGDIAERVGALLWSPESPGANGSGRLEIEGTDHK
ncbi:tyrosine-type recombinase/integrase [Jannaschia sp. R86511]|uniref:tyrosine-type recombinase/integrase n=1 Tax=Jannaschia sp. R86511 TaxID=3093853 RepID=UPI0036D2EE38